MNGTASVLQPGPEVVLEVGTGSRFDLAHRLGRRGLVGLLVLAVAAFVFGYLVPRLVGTTVADVRTALSTLSAREAVVLTLLWISGLVAHSFVLTGALPGLNRRRALTLNLTGSAVSNLMPFGGAAGMSLNYLMIRSWGIDAAAFAAFTFVTNVWVVLLKLVMPTLALTALLASGGVISGTMRWTAGGSVLALALLVLVLVAALADPAVASRVLRVFAVPVSAIRRLLGRPPGRDAFLAAGLASREAAIDVVSGRWLQLSAGMLAYGALQAVLLWGCLHYVGSHLGPAAVLAGFAVDRVLTLIVLTPGGAGFAEAGIVAALVALGGAPASVVAGVLLYRAFTFALEIPVGGTWLTVWLLARRRTVRRPATEPDR